MQYLNFTSPYQIDGQTYTLASYVDELGNVSGYSCAEMDHLKTATLTEMLKAIKKRVQADKKGFQNPKAYMVQDGFSESAKVIEVMVTSVRDEHSAWVSYGGGKRGVERLNSLYANKIDLEMALGRKRFHLKEATRVMNEVDRWKPVPCK